MARKIYITGDAQGSAILKEDEDIVVEVSVKRALIANLANEVSVVSYAKNAGDAVSAATSELSSRCSGNAKTASKLKDARNIKLKGDAEGEINFDGSMDVVADVSVKKCECDGNGNNIAETYIKKTDFIITEYEGVPQLLIMKNGKTYRFSGVSENG